MREILFREDGAVFSYRVAGLLVRDGKVLLQRDLDGSGYAVPGGHVDFGETNAETLVREFREEMGVAITVGDLKWVGEVFFPWGERRCHQIGLYYAIHLSDDTQLPVGDIFTSSELTNGVVRHLEFRWFPLETLSAFEVYPTAMPTLMAHWHDGVQHFVEKQ